ncbi:MAG: nucleotidyltransferase substrate binding protein, partial [Chloroflexi bacterium]|nr:nucleotidyltransferase substrate binding protein [Chloroflexota bacterium]
MEKLSEKLESCRRALATLKEALDLPFSVVVRDACIQRFEYSFESLWKLLKAYLREYEGVPCNSPKACFREALKAGLLTSQQAGTCLRMTDDRNLTSHTYIEAVAETLYRKLPEYLMVMMGLLEGIRQRAGP